MVVEDGLVRLREKFVEACHLLTLLYLQSLQLRLHLDDGFKVYNISKFIDTLKYYCTFNVKLDRIQHKGLVPRNALEVFKIFYIYQNYIFKPYIRGNFFLLPM